MATDLGCPIWLRGTRGLLVNDDKHVRALVAGSTPAIPPAPHPLRHPSTHKAWVRGLSPDTLCYNSLI